MIRFLQKDNRFVKAIFVIIISVACVTMVITLIPGIFNNQASNSNVYATISYPGILGRFLPPKHTITMPQVQQLAARALQEQGMPDQYLQFMIPQAGQSLIQRHLEMDTAHKLGIHATDGDVRHFLHSGVWGQVLFPHGKYIGDQAYQNLVSQQFDLTTAKFENEIKEQIEENRLRDMISGAVTVSPAEVQAAYVKQGTKINFQYAVLDSDALRKTINPTDAQLQKYFQQNASRYAHAIPETRTIRYIAFDDSQIPGGAPQVTDAEIQQYYNQNQSQYQVPEEVKVRHILIPVSQNATAAQVAAAKAKAQGILDELRKDNGKNFAELAKKDSGDPGSAPQGGELGWIKRGVTVPAFQHVAFSQNVGQISGLVRTQFGFHIIQTEAKQAAHTQPLSQDLMAQIKSTLMQQKAAQAAQAFAEQLQKQATKEGLAKTAAANHLSVTTSDSVQQGANLPNMQDSSKLVAAAFNAQKNGAPGIASTGNGFAIFKVTDIVAAHAPTFDTYKTQILSDYRDDQIPVLLSQQTNELAAKAKSMNSLAKAAKSMGATLMTSGLVGRTDQVPEIGDLQQVAPSLFSLNQGDISKAINTGRSGVVAQITQKQLPDAADIQKHFEETRQQLLNQQREETFAVFLTHLERQYEKDGRIHINRSATSMPPGGSQS
jgi:peptidyl-prolyl cis-trans isomerase D